MTVTPYFLVKLVHIISATLLFGTGLGTAFFMFSAFRSSDAAAIKVTSRHVVLADWIFTTPAIVVQFTTGLWLTSYLQIPYSSAWFVAVIALFVTVGLCWLPVVWLQIRLKKLMGEHRGGDLPPEFSPLMRLWVGLGIPAFAITLVLFWLMVFKPGTALLIG